MPIGEKTESALRDFGLTSYEIRSYVSLLEGGAMTASEVSDAAAVPYSKVYDVLRNLEKKGWIESEQSRPAKFYPKPPVEAVETTKLARENLLKAGENQLLSELTPVYERKESQERPNIWIARSEFNILARVREMLAESSSEILAAIPVLPEAMLDTIEPLLLHLNARGVKISVMITDAVDKKLVNRLRQFANIRIRHQMFAGGIVCDMRQVILLFEEDGKRQPSLAIWADHIGLTRLARSYFEYLWAEAEDA